MYYKVSVDYVGKSVGTKGFDGWNKLYSEDKSFATLQDAKKFIKETYGNKSRQKMYVDKKDGSTQHVGYIYKMGIERDWSHNEPDRWYEQHWVACTEVKETPVII